MRVEIDKMGKGTLHSCCFVYAGYPSCPGTFSHTSAMSKATTSFYGFHHSLLNGEVSGQTDHTRLLRRAT